MDITIIFFLWVMHFGSPDQNKIGAYPNEAECEKSVGEMEKNIWGCEGWKVTWDQDGNFVEMVRLPK